MNRSFKLIIAATCMILAGCSAQNEPAVMPDPWPITADAVGHYCAMDLIEHDGPKGQIFIRGRSDPLWFSTIRQVLAYTIMPDSPRGLDAIYVTDMGIVKNMRQPEQESWMDARKAYFVTESKLPGGMGGEDPLPFGDRAKADEFAAEYGGTVLTFDEIPEDYILHYDMFEFNPMTIADDPKAGLP